MNLRKILIFILSVVTVLSLTFALAACEGGGETSDNQSSPEQSAEQSISQIDGQSTEQSAGQSTIESGEQSTSQSASDPSSGEQSSSTIDLSLAAPTEVAVDNVGKVTWKRVSGATAYELEINGQLVTSKFTNYDLLKLPTLPEDGAFDVKVRTVKSEARSDWSASVEYDYEGLSVVTPTVSGMDGTKICWEQPTYATFTGIAVPYPIIIVGGVENKLGDSVCQYDLAGISQKTSVELTYKADGVYLKDSKTVKFVYDGAKLAFAAPTNVRMEGNVLKFDEVIGANAYYLRDVYKTQTELSNEEIIALESDRNGKFLIKEMWAGNTDLNIADSEPTDVTYFTEAEGAGTEANPYKISTTTHLRFIEYYEALNQSKYYELQNDIVFEDYTPANDEEYSNFYDLGSLSGTLDGNGYSIKNIVVYYKDGYMSLFNTVFGVIKNVTFENTRWRTWTVRTNDGIMHDKGGECSVLCFQNKGLIENVTLRSGSVTAAKDGAAGLVAKNYGVIRYCTVEEGFAVYGENEAGAIAVYNEGDVEYCTNYATVAGGSKIGGIVSRNAGKVYRCANYGAIDADICGGGIVGYNYNLRGVSGFDYQTRIVECVNKGAVSCTAYAGGIAGRNGSDGLEELGETSYANAEILACYNQGTISGVIGVAGIVGQNFGYYSAEEGEYYGVRGCYNSGDVNHNVNGFVANRIYLSVSNCYWAEADAPDIYVHYWVGAGGSTYQTQWPGVKMEKTTVGSTTFYFVEMNEGYATNQLSGVVFSRVNPENTAIYYVNSDWDSGASLVQPCAAAIAAYNNAVYDCAYKSAYIGGTQTAITATYDGNIYNCQAMTTSQLQGAFEALNEAIGYEAFAEQQGLFPCLKWETEA